VSDLGEEEVMTERGSGNNYWPLVSPGKSGEDRNGSRELLIRTSHTLREVGAGTRKDQENAGNQKSRSISSCGYLWEEVRL